MSYTIEQANELLRRHFQDKPDYIVNKLTSDKKFIFTTVDNQKIIKIVRLQDAMRKGIQLYQRFSSLVPGCNICKLLEYKEIDGMRIIIIMENCGEDLFDFLMRENDKIKLNQLLQLLLELFKQIICLQNTNPRGIASDSDTPFGIVHGDIKLENVAVKVTEDGNLKVALIDFDDFDEIQKIESTYRVKVGTFTKWFTNQKDKNGKIGTVRDPNSITIMNCSKENSNFIRYFLTIPTERSKLDSVVVKNGIRVYYNIPTALGDKLSRRDNDRMVTGSLDYLHIIDLCSWSYVIALALQVSKQQVITESCGSFVYNTLLAIVMNILIPNNNQPRDPPVDCFDRVINKVYCDKVVNGMSVLSRLLSESYVPNDKYTHSKVKLFFELIQLCSTEEELYRRFTNIVTGNSEFYDNVFQFEDDEGRNVETAFATVNQHIQQDVAASPVASPAVLESVASSSADVAAASSADVAASSRTQSITNSGFGGATGFRKTMRRRRTHKKMYRTYVYKKKKMISRSKRMRNKTKIRRSL
jgi:serine/threonine protein kinase